MSGAGVSVVTLRQRLPSDGDFQQCLVNGIEANDKPASGADDPRVHAWIKANGCQTRERWVWFSSCLSRLGRTEGKPQGPVGAASQHSRPPPAHHTHRTTGAGNIVIVQGRPAGVRIAVGGAPHVGVSGQNTPIQEAEREEAGYDLRWITEPSGSADGCSGSARGCGWRNVGPRAGSGVLQPSGRTLTCRTCSWDRSTERGRSCRDSEGGPAHAWCATNNPAFSIYSRGSACCCQ